MTPDEVAEGQRDARSDLEATQKAQAILGRGGSSAYEKALRALRADSRDWWFECVEEGEYEAAFERVSVRPQAIMGGSIDSTSKAVVGIYAQSGWSGGISADAVRASAPSKST